MGLFSSKKKTKVATSAVRVIEDNQIPETIKTSTLEAILNDGEIVDYLLDGLLASPALQVERMYEYGQKHYYYGLPNDNFQSELDAAGVVQQFIESEQGRAIEIDYIHCTSLSNTHLAWQTLLDEYQYDRETNRIGKLDGLLDAPVFLKDIIPVYRQETVEDADPGTLEPWGLPASSGFTPGRLAQFTGIGKYRKHTPYKVITEGSEGAEVWYVYQTDEGLVEDFFFVSIESYMEEEDFYQVHYTYTDEDTGEGYWTYQVGTSIYPEIDATMILDFDRIGSYFPFVFFRHNRTNLATPSREDTDAYKTSVKIADYLGIDYQGMADSIYENPDIGDVEQAVMMFAVPANTENEVERRYLFDFFNTMYYARPRARGVYGGLLGSLFNHVYEHLGMGAITIQDKDFKLSLSYGGITKRKVAGSIGPIGSHDSDYGPVSHPEEYQVKEGDKYVTKTRTLTTVCHYYRRQLTSNQYEEIMVVDLKTVYHIYRGYTDGGSRTSDKLLIPLDRAVSDLIPLTVREELYMRSLHMVFNSRVTTKVKWYESSWFRAVLIIVAVVITVISLGKGWKAIAAAVAVGASVSAIATMILIAIMKRVMVTYALKLFVKEVGVEVGFILAIVAIGTGLGATYLQSPWASTLMQTSLGLSSATSNATQDLLADLSDDADEFSKLMKDKNSELDRAKDLLDTNGLINPLMFTDLIPTYRMGELPQNYYDRSVHAGNLGALGIASIEHFHDIMLKLPELHETLGEADE